MTTCHWLFVITNKTIVSRYTANRGKHYVLFRLTTSNKHTIHTCIGKVARCGHLDISRTGKELIKLKLWDSTHNRLGNEPSIAASDLHGPVGIQHLSPTPTMAATVAPPAHTERKPNAKFSATSKQHSVLRILTHFASISLHVFPDLQTVYKTVHIIQTSIKQRKNPPWTWINSNKYWKRNNRKNDHVDQPNWLVKISASLWSLTLLVPHSTLAVCWLVYASRCSMDEVVNEAHYSRELCGSCLQTYNKSNSCVS